MNAAVIARVGEYASGCIDLSYNTADPRNTADPFGLIKFIADLRLLLVIILTLALMVVGSGWISEMYALSDNCIAQSVSRFIYARTVLLCK